MILWLDAQLPSSVAGWIRATFGMECHAIRDLGLRDAEDLSIFQAARDAGAVVMTEDADFIELLERSGPPPQVFWLSSGNTSNTRLRAIHSAALPSALPLIEQGERLIEIGDRPSTDTDKPVV